MAHDPGGGRQCLVDVGLAEQAGGGAGAEPVGDGDGLLLRPAGALAHQQRHSLPGVEHVGGGMQVRLGGQVPTAPPGRCGDDDAVFLRGLRGLLDVVRQDDDGGGADLQGGRGRQVPLTVGMRVRPNRTTIGYG